VFAARIDTKFKLRGKMIKKRDSAYYRNRIQREFPAIHADILSGKKTVRQAAISAGLRRQPTRGDAIIRNLERASPADMKQVRNWLRARSGPKKGATAPIADPSGKLIPAVVTFIKDGLRRDRMTPGRLLSKIGKYSNFDIRLSLALKGERLPPDILADLAGWLRRNGYA
jgi:hypothetical protein